jgi:hypothetical protein
MRTSQPSHRDIQDRLESGNARFKAIEDQLFNLVEQQKMIVKQLECLPELQKDIAATKEIVEVWNKGKSTAQAFVTIGKFIKWIAGILTAVAAIFLVVKAGTIFPVSDINRPK